MAQRTTVQSVQDLLGRNYDGKTGLDGFIKTATTVVDAIVRCADSKGTSLTDEQLERIEAHLSAHYYQRSDPGFSSKSTGRSSASFHGQTGMMLQSTHYGQDALGLDTSGCLGSFNNGGRVSMLWLGKTKSEQLDYEQRMN